ncbi:unnamed protein product [Lactuca saligna]|uniref:Protein kinase domain-containing protein n=1 Tax=Lactuca saligna TaxID=75948 RepID=A0AA35V5M8_LACSI|nr:unnamed protein product [Lactuca saligna]
MGCFSCVDSRVEEKSNHQKVGADRPEVHPSTPPNNFSPDCFLGARGFDHVYRGRLQGGGQVVVVKQLDRNGLQGNREFLIEVLMLSLLHHPNLVNLIGYCPD